MSSELQDIQSKYFQLIESIPFIEKDLDYSILDSHIPHLENLDRIGKSAISVFDLFRKTHVYMSPLYRRRLDISDDRKEEPEGFEQLMHPDDLVTVMESGFYFLKMAMSMNLERLGDYKLINDYRVQTSKDTWMRLTEQHQILETDAHGNIWLALSVIDVSSNPNVHGPISSRLVNHRSGKIVPFIKHNGSAVPFYELTNREKEILHLIADGYVSKQIAGELHISVHTVNTHRQNIIGKMNVTNTAEAVRLAAKTGLLE